MQQTNTMLHPFLWLHKAWQVQVVVAWLWLDKYCSGEGLHPFTLSYLSACHSSLLTFCPFTWFHCVFLTFPPGLTLFSPLYSRCQSEADDDSEMRTQVHWARFMALLSASHHHHHHHQMHWATPNIRHQSLCCRVSALACLLLLLLTHTHYHTPHTYTPDWLFTLAWIHLTDCCCKAASKHTIPAHLSSASLCKRRSHVHISFPVAPRV